MFPEDRFLEVLMIGALALIVIGPKDLPVVMRKLGKAVGKMRAMAAEFRASFDELARQSELDELRKEVDALRQSQAAAARYDPGAHSTFSEIEAGLHPSPAVEAPAPTPQPDKAGEPS